MIGRIHKISGYLVDACGDYNADDIKVSITERSGLDVFSQHLHIETAEVGEFEDDHPLNNLNCSLAECEQYFSKEPSVQTYKEATKAIKESGIPLDLQKVIQRALDDKFLCETNN